MLRDVVVDVPAVRKDPQIALLDLAQGEVDQLGSQALAAVGWLHAGVREGADVAVLLVVRDADDPIVEPELVARTAGGVGDGLLGHISALPAVRGV